MFITLKIQNLVGSKNYCASLMLILDDNQEQKPTVLF